MTNAIHPTPSPRAWSHYQEDVFSLFTERTGNGVVEAVAGSGKTTTLVEGMKRWTAINPKQKGAFVCFNKSIATELQSKVPAGIEASTLHSLGYRAVLKTFKGCKVDERKIYGYSETVALSAADDRLQAKGIENDLQTAYGLLKSTMVDLKDVEAIGDLLAEYGVELKMAAVSMPLFQVLDRLMVNDTSRCSFDEMLTFVVDHQLPMRQFDLVCVDEAQDMNAIQLKLLDAMVGPNGRLIAVGDSKQAIYHFRGASSNAIERIRDAFNVPTENVLPLSISYRCPKAVVARAQTIVSHIEASATAIEGEVIDADVSMMNATLLAMDDRSMGICRCNGPLVGCALRLIKSGRKAVVRGRDIGKGIAKLARDLSKRAADDSLSSLIEAARLWEANEVSRLTAARKMSQANMVVDRVDTLIALCENITTHDELIARIETIFSDQQAGVVFSSIHRSKGLEADTVVWLEPGLSEFFYTKAEERGDAAGADSERCLAYVAITRAKRKLVLQPLRKRGEE